LSSSWILVRKQKNQGLRASTQNILVFICNKRLNNNDAPLVFFAERLLFSQQAQFCNRKIRSFVSFARKNEVLHLVQIRFAGLKIELPAIISTLLAS